MKFYLPTKEECDNIVKNNEAFYKTETVVEGQNVVLYDYRLATINDFKDNQAFELRGLCFIEQSDGTWKRNILLNKFFNVNQTSMDNILEIVIDNDIVLKVEETHSFRIKLDDGTIKEKFAKDLTKEDYIIGWDELSQ